MAILSPGSKHARERRRSLIRILAFVACCALVPVFRPSVKAESGAAAEYRVKAAFLLNFTRFVEWPKSAFETDTSPLVIGILGNDPFGKSLDETVMGETVNGRKLEVRRYASLSEVEGCHILFISPSESRYSRTICERLQGRPILTVGDSDAFTKAGGMIGLYTENRRIRFRMNVEAGRRASLSFSSKLLRLADAPPSAAIRPGPRYLAALPSKW
jgi:hypothetical protein